MRIFPVNLATYEQLFIWAGQWHRRCVTLNYKYNHDNSQNKISDFTDFYFWVMADCIYNLTKNLITKTKVFKIGQIYRKDAHCFENDFLVHEFFFVRLQVFEIWPILYSTAVNGSELQWTEKCGRDFWRNISLMLFSEAKVLNSKPKSFF